MQAIAIESKHHDDGPIFLKLFQRFNRRATPFMNTHLRRHHAIRFVGWTTLAQYTASPPEFSVEAIETAAYV